jgi:hypothetical protein
MRINVRWWILAALVIAAFAVIGCSKKTNTAGTTATTQKAAPSGEMAEHGATEHEETGATITPAGSVPEIWTQIADEKAELSKAIENGQLADVHHIAFGIRDLVAALADKAGTSNPALAPKLKDMAAQVATSASKLDELGDAPVELEARVSRVPGDEAESTSESSEATSGSAPSASGRAGDLESDLGTGLHGGRRDPT